MHSTAVKMKVWYRMLSVIAVVMKMAALLIWLVQAGYTAENGEAIKIR